MAHALPTSSISWGGSTGQLQGAWAQAADSKGGVLVIHENKGLTDWVRSVAARLAGAGYSALAIDLLSEKGGTAAFRDPAEATAALSTIAPEQFTHDMNSGVAELKLRAPGQQVGVVGFCFGGGLVWQLLGAGALGVSAAVPFYRPLPPNPDFAGSKAAVLGIYAPWTPGLPARKRRPRPLWTGTDWSTTWWSNPTLTMPSSTTPAPATTPWPRLMPGSACWTG
jgi:carboxymethylenebutenolidase